MSLFTLWIGVIILFGWLEGVGVVVEPLVEPSKFVVYVIELALMYSTRFTDQMAGGLDAIYGNIQRYASGRSSPTSNGSGNDRVHSPDHHMGSNQ
jgi:ABC-type amino acid transport system permease subunit